MADISVTATSVLKGTNAKTGRGIAGATVTAGQPIYRDSSDNNELKPADANASDATATVIGIALHGSSDGQPLEYITEGNLTFNAVLTSGTVYVASATAGGIAPVADLTTGWRTTILGVGTSTTNMYLSIFPSGATV